MNSVLASRDFSCSFQPFLRSSFEFFPDEFVALFYQECVQWLRHQRCRKDSLRILQDDFQHNNSISKPPKQNTPPSRRLYRHGNAKRKNSSSMETGYLRACYKTISLDKASEEATQWIQKRRNPGSGVIEKRGEVPLACNNQL